MNARDPDAGNRRTNMADSVGTTAWRYDGLGRIVAVAAPEGTYAFTYLSNGIRRATVAYPNGVTEVRAHDELARCTSLAFLSGTNPLLSIAYAYDDGDRRTNEVWSTGRAMAYGYDDAHQLTSVAASRPSDALSAAGYPLLATPPRPRVPLAAFVVSLAAVVALGWLLSRLCKTRLG